MEQWLATLDELLIRPFEVDDRGRSGPHHVDLRVSRDFYDQFDDEHGRGEEEFQQIRADYQADRERLAEAITGRYGSPERIDVRPWFDGDGSPDAPGASLFTYLCDWYFEFDLWRAGTRGIIVEVGQYDKELPLQLMLIVGDLSDGQQATPQP